MKELELLIDRLQNPDEHSRAQWVDELINVIDSDPLSGIQYLVNSAAEDGEKIYRVAEQLELRGLEKAGNLKECVLLSLENQFIGKPVLSRRAVASGWKSNSDARIMGLDMNVEGPDGDSFGASAYSVNLLLDEEYKIAQIIRFVHQKLTDEWDLEISRLLGKAKRQDSIPEEIPCFPVYMHRIFVQKLEELI
ncbi:MAG TPA: hypothetical protein VLH15_08675 [Dehalococcoidales bacterium]|nr:hypothetical protein [Dehalococcoidales bacterium]